MFGWGTKVPAILPQDVEKQMQGPNAPYVLDVRTIAEFRSGHIPGARLIPLAELGRRTAELPKNQTIVTVFRSGSRSQMAARQLVKLGYNVYNMVGGMMKWRGRTVR